ncbi:MAG: hypothetical protein Q8R18_02885 [bacterium]|nr:hypothetical protein [bacterium]
MTQTSLFQDPELRPMQTLSSSDKETLEIIAQRAAEYPLLYGGHLRDGYRTSTAEQRLGIILGRLKGGPSSHNYLVCHTGVIIGYLSIWGGYDPHEMEAGRGEIELGFLDPLKRQYEGLLRVKAEGILSELEKADADDW